MLSMMNRTKTFILLSTLTALLLWAGQAMGGRTGMTIAIVAAAAMNLGSYWFGHKLVLRMYSAQEVTQADADLKGSNVTEALTGSSDAARLLRSGHSRCH